MRRLFGLSKPKTPGPTLSEATQMVDTRIGSIEAKIKSLDAELVKYRDQMKRMRPGPAQNALKQRAMQVLKRKKMYESQLNQLYGQSFNMEQTNFVTQTLKDTAVTVDAMKGANMTMRQQFKQLDIDKIEDLHYDMQDLMDQANEIQDIMSRTYATPEFDEADLESELESLGEEYEAEMESTPAYLAPATTEAASTDAYGLPLPSVPSQQLTAG